MTYLEMLLVIAEHGEKILEQGTNSLFTQHHRYLRQPDATQWLEDTQPGAPEQHYGREGIFFTWKRDES
jgi:hypothetical protein